MTSIRELGIGFQQQVALLEVGSYPSAEVQLAYSTAPADRAVNPFNETVDVWFDNSF